MCGPSAPVASRQKGLKRTHKNEEDLGLQPALEAFLAARALTVLGVTANGYWHQHGLHQAATATVVIGALG